MGTWGLNSSLHRQRTRGTATNPLPPPGRQGIPRRGTATNPRLVPTRAAQGKLQTTLRLGQGGWYQQAPSNREKNLNGPGPQNPMEMDEFQSYL